MTDYIRVRDDGPVRIITMNRPDKKNALTQTMYEGLAQALNAADAAAAIRCVLLSGAPGAFTAGNDLEDFLAAGEASGAPMAKALDFLRALVECRKPIVAAVDGIAIGIGTTMLFHCDYVVAGSQATFATPFTHLGLVPEGGSSLLAPRLMGHVRAFALLVLGQPLPAADALTAGLVNALVEPQAADMAAMKIAQDLARLPPEAVAQSRQLLRPPKDEILQRIEAEATIFVERMRSPEALAAFRAFLSRKK